MSDQAAVIIGGGVIGVCSAHYLARAGVEVVLIERGEIASEASSGNAGQMAFGHPPIPRPGLTWQAIKWMFNGASPLHISPRAGVSVIGWLWRFRRACSREQLELSMRALAEMGRCAKPLFDEIITGEGVECDYRKNGALDVYRTKTGLARGREHAELLRRLGFDAQELSAQQVYDREPSLRPGAVGGVQCAEDVSLEPELFVKGVLEGAKRKGARVLTDCSVDSIIVQDGAVHGVKTSSHGVVDANNVVLAAGIWSSRLVASVGVRIPMQAGKGYHIDLVQEGAGLRAPCVLGERYIAATPMGGRLRLAGTLEFTGVNHVLRRRRIDAIVRGASEYLTGVDEASAVSRWCGLRPCAADGLPIIGWAPQVRGLCVATGHAMLGMTLGPVTGKLVCELLTEQETCVDLAPMRVDRF